MANEPKRISELDPLLQPTGAELVPVSYQGNNYKVRLDSVKFFLNKADFGLSNVDNTSDLDKPISNATATALMGKSDVDHHHVIAEIDGLSDVIAEKADINHQHEMTDVVGLDTALAGKADTGHTHTLVSLPEVGQALTQKADVNHTHDIANVNGLQDNLDSLQSQINNIEAGTPTNIDQAIQDSSALAQMLALKADIAQLDTKADVMHSHDATEIGNLIPFITEVVVGGVSGQGGLLGNKADIGHMHTSADITDFEDAVDYAASNRGYIKEAYNDW